MRNLATLMGRRTGLLPIITGMAWILAGLSGMQASDCVRWLKRTDVGSFGQRMHHAMAYDPERGVTVFFGGEIGKTGSETFFDDTHEYNGTNWLRITINGSSPPKRSMHAMAYDPIRKTIMMIGGRNSSNPGLSDCWIYQRNGVVGTWKFLGDIVKTVGSGMVWNPVRQRMMVYGGFKEITDPPGGFVGAVGLVEWDGLSWENQGPSSLENSVYGHGMAWDNTRQLAMMFGGFGYVDESNPIDSTWELSSEPVWVKQSKGPSARGYAAMAYDERRQRMVMVGGAGQSPEVGEECYEYDAAAKRWITGARLPLGQGRAGAKMVYDSRRQVLVLTGGAGGGAENGNNGGRYSDTWELVPGHSILLEPPNLNVNACSDARISVEADGGPPLHYTWRRDGKPVQEDDRIRGANTATLSIQNVRYGDGGQYDVVIRDGCNPVNVITSRLATVSILPHAEWGLRAQEGPPPRFSHSMAYDSQRGVTVLFGGKTNSNHMVPFGDLWEWDGAVWRQRTSENLSNSWVFLPGKGWRPSYTHQPVRRAQAAMAYDSKRGRTVLFGGEALNPDGGFVILRDLWELDGIRWYFRGTNGPVARYGASMAYDANRETMVMFGGQPEPAPNESSDADWVWEWNGTNWHGTLFGPEIVIPSRAGYRTQARMTYDSYRQVVVFGPTLESFSSFAFWDWDGRRWKAAPLPDPADPLPGKINGTGHGALAFDPERRRSVWFGGHGIQSKEMTLHFDGKAWVLFLPVNHPTARTYTAAVYDTRRKVTVLFGGAEQYFGSTGQLGDTWEYTAPDLPLILEEPRSQYVKEGDDVTFKVRVQSPPNTNLTYEWYRGTSRIDENIQQRISGSQTAELHIKQATLSDAEFYRVKVSNSCGEVWSAFAQLTLNPKLQIYSKTVPMSLVWEELPQLFLETAAQPEGPWIPVLNAQSPFHIGTSERGQFFRLREMAP